MIKHIIVGWYNKLFKRNNELYRTRMLICEPCEFRKKITKKESICSQCGCVLSAKLRVNEEHCVLNKW